MANKRWVDLIGIGSYVSLPGRLWELAYRRLHLLTGSLPVYVDIDFPMFIRTTGLNRPTYQTFNTDFEMLRWAVNDFLNVENQELIHGWKQGSKITWHLHFVTNGIEDVAKYVKWKIDYCYAEIGQTYNTTQTVQAEIEIPANTPANTMIIASIGDFTPAIKIASHVKAKLTRVASTGAAPANDPFCDMMQMHVLCDSVGSETIQIK